MARRSVWETVYDRFDPDLPAITRAWRADRGRSPAGDIVRSLGMPRAQPHVLVTGTIGTGKSTELLRIGEARSADEFVVLLDLRRHFREVVGDEQALQGISSWEVVFLAGLAVVRAASELLPYPIPPDYLGDLGQAWQKLAKMTDPSGTAAQVEIGTLAKAMIVLASAAVPVSGVAAGAAAGAALGLKVLEAATGAVKWSLPIGRKKQRALLDQDAEMQGLLAAVNRIISYVHTKTRRVLLLLDGLDRIVKLDRATALFIDSEIIAQLACPLVVSGPFAVRSHPAAGSIPRFSKVCVLVNEPVLEQQAPANHGDGVDFFCDVFRLRTTDLSAPDLIADAPLRKLAYYSGGRARDFVKSIRMLAEQAWLADAPAATDDLVARVLDEARRLLETGLDAGHIEILEKVVADPHHRLPADARARELLSYGQLLPYPNESEWYYPHPLLTMHLVRASTAGSSG